MKEAKKISMLYLAFVIISGVVLIYLQIYGKGKPVDYISLFIFVYVSVISGLPFISKYINTMKLPGCEFGLREQMKKMQEKQNDLEVKHDILRKDVQEKLNEVLVYSMSWYVYDKLKKLRDGNQEYIYDESEHARRDFQFLQDHGFINLDPLLSELKKGENLIGRLTLTPCGHRFVELREEYESKYQDKQNIPDKRDGRQGGAEARVHSEPCAGGF